MKERPSDFLEEVLARYFGPGVGSCPRMRRADLEELLTDDTRQRLADLRSAATEWGDAERVDTVEITSVRLLITPRGLVYPPA